MPTSRSRGELVARIAAVLVLAIAALAYTHAGEGRGRHHHTRHHQPSLLALGGSGLIPRFAPGRHDYVARCFPGAAKLELNPRRRVTVSIGSTKVDPGGLSPADWGTPGTDFRINASRSGVRESFRIRCLPRQFPTWTLRRFRPGPEGLFVVSTVKSKGLPPWVIVFDQDGDPRWWYRPATLAYDAQVLTDGTVAWARGFGDGYGIDRRSAEEIHSLDGSLRRLIRTKGSITDVHEFAEAARGHLYLESYVPRSGIDLSPYGGPRSASVVFPRVQEIDSSGQVVWTWSAWGHIGLDEAKRWWHDNVLGNPHKVRGAKTYDAIHLNAIEPWGRRQVVISARHTDAIYGISRATGEVVWKLGGTHTPQSLRVIGDPHGSRPFGGQHDVRVTHGVLSVFDNGTHRGLRPRAAFYRLNLKAGTATYISSLQDPTITSSHCCGSVRRFGDGWLVDWGDNRWVTGFDRRGRIAFRLHLSSSTYRAVPIPPGAVTNRDLERGLEAMEP